MANSLAGGTFGRQDQIVDTGLFIVSKTTHAPRLAIGRHAHERASINLVLGGVYRERFRGSAAGHRSATIIAKPAGESHSNDFGEEGASCLLIEVADQEARQLGAFVDLLDAPLVREGGKSCATGISILAELEASDRLSSIVVESAVLHLLVNLSRERGVCYSKEPAWMKSVLELLHDCPPGSLGLSQLAARIGVHPVHLARTFRRSHGTTVGTYARQLQINQAVELLRQPGARLSDVAAAAGFSDQSHMTRLIKRATGRTPKQLMCALR